MLRYLDAAKSLNDVVFNKHFDIVFGRMELWMVHVGGGFDQVRLKNKLL